MNSNKKDLTILFAEDEEQIRQNYCNILREDFKEVYEASNGEEGFELFKEKRPQIVIADINMPKSDGIELITRVRQIDKNCKIIILTAHLEIDYLLKSTELNLTKYLVKPVKRNEFNAALDAAVDQLKSFHVVEKRILKIDENYSWDFENNCLFKDSSEIELTKSEKMILNTLFSNPNKELTYDDLIYSVWNDYDHSRKDTLKTMINNLRRKLNNNDLIKTMYGIGYKFTT